MDYSQCENDRKNIAFAKRTLQEILEAAGAQDILTIDRYAHLVGGCRMGTDPERSVVGPDHRVWGVPNLLIADGSVMPTQGSANPAITIMALASRLAAKLERKRLDQPGRAKRLSLRRREAIPEGEPEEGRGQTDVVAPTAGPGVSST
jgi:choline dehydrogenase-like flavoprotein